jgi:hypothetical protein
MTKGRHRHHSTRWHDFTSQRALVHTEDLPLWGIQTVFNCKHLIEFKADYAIVHAPRLSTKPGKYKMYPKCLDKVQREFFALKQGEKMSGNEWFS